MFKHAFHGGPAVEIFSTSGNNPLEKWKVTGGNLQKAYDKLVKGYIYSLDGQQKMQLPKEDKDVLGLLQQYLVFQIFIPSGKNLHIEVVVTDSAKTKRRLIFHSGAKEIVSNPLHARIPITNFKRNQWLNLSIDVFAFAHQCFRGIHIRSIDLIIVTATCKLRKIFTMKNPLYDDQMDEDQELQESIQQLLQDEQRDNLPFDFVPKNYEFPQGFPKFNQLIFPQRLFSEKPQDQPPQIQEKKQDSKQKVQLAFGQRVPANQSNPKQGKQALNQQQNINIPINTQDQLYSEKFYTPLPVSQENFNKGKNAQAVKFPLSTKNQGVSLKQEKKNNKDIYSQEELKENSHYLVLQESPSQQIEEDINIEDTNLLNDLNAQDKKQMGNNPWNQKGIGRKNHDGKNVTNTGKKQGSPRNQKMVQQQSKGKKFETNYNSKQECVQGVTGSENFYSYDNNKTEDASSIDDHFLMDSIKKIEMQRSKINEIQSKYQKPKINFFDEGDDVIESSEMVFKENKFEKLAKSKASHLHNRPPLQQDKQDHAKKLSNYQTGHFNNLNQWDNDHDEHNISIEEAIEKQHENLVNEQEKKYPERSSIEYQNNPMFYELEFNNEEEVQEKKEEGNQLYRLESQRREQRRPFSPPFKCEQQQQHFEADVSEFSPQPFQEQDLNEQIKEEMSSPEVEKQNMSEFDKKLEVLKVQKAQILRDSLEELPLQASGLNQKAGDSPPAKAIVENEEGEVLDVVYDPVLKCYYEPRILNFNMDDQLVQEILSSKSKPKSIIYQRLSDKKESLSQVRSGFGKSPDPNKQTNQRQLNEKLDYDKDTITSVKDQIKSVQKIINNKRRRNLNIRGMGEKLTEDNLRTINQKSKDELVPQTIQKQGEDQDQKIKNFIQDLSKEDLTQQKDNKCVLCDLDLSQHDIKISKKLVDFILERGQKSKVILRIKQKLQQKVEEGHSVGIKLEELVEDSELPLICFKCHYDMMLKKDGRHQALNLFHVAANVPEEENQYKTPQKEDNSGIIKRECKAHQESKEFNDLRFLKGSFYDYRSRSIDPSRNYFTQSPYISAVVQKRYNQMEDVHGIISIAKESKGLNLSNIEENSVQKLTEAKRLRQWREDFNDKFSRKYGSLIGDERQNKILTKLEKERGKFHVGLKLARENQRVFSEYLRQAQSKSAMKTLGDSEYKDDLEKKSKTTKNTMHSSFYMCSAQHETHNSDIFNKIKPLDKTFYKKISSYGAFANATFNAGVYINPAQQYA